MSSVVEVPLQLALAIGLAAAPPTLASVPVAAPVAARADLGLTDEAWLAALRAHGASVGLESHVSRIFATSSGRIYVPAAADRAAILALKSDPAAATKVVAAAARARGEQLATLLGRPARLSEVYIAHLFGAEIAARLIGTAAREPRRIAVELAPQLALAHPAAFFAGARLRTAEEVVQVLGAAFEKSLREALRPVRSGLDAARMKPTLPAQHAAPGWRTSIATMR